MSSVVEKARAEADQVEAEEAEAAEAEETQPEPEPAPEPEPEPPAPPVAVDPDKIERAIKSYLTAIAKAFGDDAEQLQPCQRCSGEIPGFEPVQPPIELKQYEGYAMCPACEGVTKFLTGAKVGEWVTHDCPRCNGKGYVEKPIELAQPAPVYTFTPQPQADPYPGYGISFVPIPNAMPDAFNRPAGHPHYGLPKEHSATAGGGVA